MVSRDLLTTSERGVAAGCYTLSRTTAGRMGATTYLVPPIAILLGWAMLDETPVLLAVFGGALCLVGVVIARQPGLPVRRGARGAAVQAATIRGRGG